MCNLNSLYSVSEEYLTYGTTALHMASENGHAMIMYALLDAGADVETTDLMRKTLFIIIIILGCLIFVFFKEVLSLGFLALSPIPKRMDERVEDALCSINTMLRPMSPFLRAERLLQSE